MNWGRETKTSAVDRRLFVGRWLDWVLERFAGPADGGPMRFLEELESRVLLSNTPVATPDFLLYHPNGSGRPSVTASPVGLTPSIIRRAYGIDRVQFGSIVGDGTGQTIAIVDAYDAPTIVADLHEFDRQFGLPDPPSFIRVGQDGTTRLPGTDPAGRGDSWAIETSLDVEWAHAVAPNANILLVEALSDSFNNLFSAVNTARQAAGVSAVSMSWGAGEFSGQSVEDPILTTPGGHNGVTFITSSGDSGAFDPGSTVKDVSFPASSSHVLSVGGTFLSTNVQGNYISESGWGTSTNSGRQGGAGGGISKVVLQPAYQHGVVTQSNTFRTVPDIAMDADPRSGVAVIDTFDFPLATPWLQVGGTSLAAPLWGGVIAIANQGRALAGLSSLDGPTQTLPSIYALSTQDFHDVTTGNNGFAAAAGYDLITGRGTPIVNLLVGGLVGTSNVAQPVPPQPKPTIGSLTINPAAVPPGTSVYVTAGNVQSPSGVVSKVAFFRETNGTPGLQIGSDTSLGNGIQSGTTWWITTATNGFNPGTFTYYAVATDGANVASNTASATLTVALPAPANNNFTSAQVLNGSTITAAGSNIGATKETGEPRHAGNAGGKSVWYIWTAPASGKVTLDTHGSNFDTLLAVYTGTSVAALTLVAGNDDDIANRTLTSLLTFTAVAGKTYRIAVDGFNGASGNIALHLKGAAAPARRALAVAALFAGTGGAGTAITINAAALNTHGRHSNTLLTMYLEDSSSSPNLVVCDDEDLLETSRRVR